MPSLESSVTRHFPIEAQRIIREYSSKLRIPETVVIANFLAMLSILANFCVTGRICNRQIPAVLWFVIVGASGSGKSTLQRTLLDPFLPEWMIFRRGTRAGFEKRIQGEVLPRLLWQSDESDSIRRWSLSEQEETLFPGYDGASISRITANKEVFIPRAFISILTNTTNLERFFSPAQINNGFAARFIAISANASNVGYALNLTPESKNFLTYLVNRFSEYEKECAQYGAREVSFSPESLSLYDLWRNEFAQEIDSLRGTDIGAVYRKHPERILRVAVLLAALKEEASVDTENMIHAIEIGKWLAEEQISQWRSQLGIGYEIATPEDALRVATKGMVPGDMISSATLPGLIEEFGGPRVSKKRAGLAARNLGLYPTFVGSGNDHHRVWKCHHALDAVV